MFRAIVKDRRVLTINPAYFELSMGLERRLYELARKHCGYQERWIITLPRLIEKCGSVLEPRFFKPQLKKVIEDDDLPDYHISDELRPADKEAARESGLDGRRWASNERILVTFWPALGGRSGPAADRLLTRYIVHMTGPADHSVHRSHHRPGGPFGTSFTFPAAHPPATPRPAGPAIRYIVHIRRHGLPPGAAIRYIVHTFGYPQTRPIDEPGIRYIVHRSSVHRSQFDSVHRSRKFGTSFTFLCPNPLSSKEESQPLTL